MSFQLTAMMNSLSKKKQLVPTQPNHKFLIELLNGTKQTIDYHDSIPLSIRTTELEDFTPTKIFNLIEPIVELESYIPS